MASSPQQYTASNSAALAGWPMLHLPEPAKALVLDCLAPQDRRSLRLACHTTLLLVDTCITTLHLTAGGLSKAGLQRRFPRLRTLNISAVRRYMPPQPERQQQQKQLSQDVTLLVHDGHFASVKVLQLHNLHHTAAAMLVAACHNAQECCMHFGDMEEELPLEVPSTVRLVGSQLRDLRRLDIGACSLGDVEVRLLASCPALTALTASPDGCSAGVAGGWVTLMRMTLLGSLHVHRQHQLPEGVDLDLSAMAALTDLCFSAADQERAARRGTWLVDAAYDTLQLPAGLAQLSLLQLPVPALQLPALTCLKLTGLAECAVGSQDLARIAAGCPALLLLEVAELVLEVSCHRTPLLTLDWLRVLRRCTIQEAARLSMLLPRLRGLELRAECSFENGAAVFGCLSVLECLDIGRDPGNGQLGFHVDASEMGVLAALPRLQALRLNTTAQHVEQLPLMTQLRSVTLVIDMGAREAQLRALSRAFKAAIFSPPLMKSVTMNWWVRNVDYYPECAAWVAADAAIFLQLRAPGLSHVGWNAGRHPGCAEMSDMRLFALSVSPSIKHIDVFVRQPYEGANIPPAVTMPMVGMCAVRGNAVHLIDCR